MDGRYLRAPHLSQACGEHTNTGGGSGALARFLALIALHLFAATAFAQAPAAPHFDRIEAVQAGWNSSAPPATGWVDVSLPDNWTVRWPAYDGVVWYRLSWTQTAPLIPIGLFVDYLSMAGAVTLNGGELGRDASLVEPLTRSWNTPRHWVLAAPSLREGENVLLLRVSGLAAYRPGVGRAAIGTPLDIQARYETERWMRHDVVLFSLAVCGVLSIVFLTLWAIRRKEVAYGWLGAMYLFMVLTGIDHVKASPWPFADNHGWQIAITITYFLYSGCHSMFVLRYCGRRWPRTEMMLWIAIALVSASFLLLPYTMIRTSQNVAALLALAINTTRMIVFVVFAWRDGGWDKWLLAGCGVVFYVVGMRDLLVFIHAIDSTFYIAPFNAIAINLCMAIVLAWHFVRSLHRIEGFNDELRGKIAEARSELATTLQRQHELELVQSRLGERLSLAHDLHDGLGGMLIGNIAELEQAPENMPSRAVLDMMKELRDDLRLIIDTASAQHYGKHSLAELLAPLRHRMSRMFEVRGIESRWRADDLENTYLITTHSLDLLRVLQEALANVLKHSGAQHVDIDLIEKNGTLHLEVSDDGVGLKSTSESNSGTGLRSMQIRARRLGAALSVGSETGGTVVRLSMPLPAKPGC